VIYNPAAGRGQARRLLDDVRRRMGDCVFRASERPGHAVELARHVRRVRRWELVRYLPAMITGNLPSDHPEIRTGRCRSSVVRSATPLCVHADGEMICVPQDGVLEVAVELVPARLLVERYEPDPRK
jgi:diacylglycerol kinase family enzyme